MYRDKIEIRTTDKMNFVCSHAALGDMLTSLPAIIYARQHRYKSMAMRIWIPDWQHDLVRHLLEPYGTFEIMDLQKFPAESVLRKESDDWGGGPVSINYAVWNHQTRNRRPLVDFAFHTLIDTVPDNNNDRSYPILAPLGPRMIDGKYIVIPTNATSDNKLFREVVMRPVIEWALGAGYKVVLTGTKTSHTKVEVEGALAPIQIVSEAHMLPAALLARCIDMRDKTTLMEVRDLCGHAKAVLGVDGGTIHIAGTTATAIVYGLTTTHPRHRLICRMGNPHFRIKYVTPRDLECAGCQSNWVIPIGMDFRECAYGDNACTFQMDPQDFITALGELGL